MSSGGVLRLFTAPTDITDKAMAEACIVYDPDMFRHFAGLGWFVWSGKVWEESPAERVRGKLFAWVQELLSANGAAGCMPEIYGILARYLNVTKTDALATALKSLWPVRVDDVSSFDSDPDLLNTRSGVVNLRTGAEGPHDPGLMMTKITRCGYNPRAKHDDWEAAKRAFGNMDQDTQYWARRGLGSGCIGRTPTDDLSLLYYGGGANGKSTGLTAARAVLGTYAGIVSDDILKATDSHPTGLLDLRGLRLAVIEETPDGMKLNVQTIKKLTSGQKVKARRMHKDHVEFMPTHTLVVATNYKPVVHETDRGTWRRLAMLEFTVVYGVKPGETAVDRSLRGRLETGESGADEAVLAWLIAGAREWYAQGLTPLPAAVQATTDAWAEESDALRSFITDNMVFDPAASVPTGAVWEAFRGWQDDTSMTAFKSQRTFNKALSEHDITVTAGMKKAAGAGNVKYWLGARLRPTIVTATVSELGEAAAALRDRE